MGGGFCAGIAMSLIPAHTPEPGNCGPWRLPRLPYFCAISFSITADCVPILIKSQSYWTVCAQAGVHSTESEENVLE